MVSGTSLAIIGSVAGLAIIVSGGVAVMALKKRKEEENKVVVQSGPAVLAVGPRLYGRPFPDPFVSRSMSKWGHGIWDHRNPYHHRH
jgi:hypothetical protein